VRARVLGWGGLGWCDVMWGKLRGFGVKWVGVGFLGCVCVYVQHIMIR
jgi:hypothetical protein